MEYIDLEEPVNHKDMVLFWLNADRTTLLSGLDPYWIQWNTPWRCFIPVSLVGEADSQWFLQTNYNDVDFILDEHTGKYRLADNFKEEARETFKTIRDVAYSFLNHSIFREPLMRTPEPLNEGMLHETKDSLDSFKELIAIIKIAALDWLGFIRWFTKAFPRWKDNRNGLSEITFRQVDSLKLDAFGMRGIITEISRDYQLLNIPLYIENNVPVYFPLTLGFLSNPRFASLDPELYKEYQEEAGHREGEVDIKNLPQYESRWRDIESYDEFLQKRITVPSSTFRYWPANAERKVVDFEDWGDRDCSIGELSFLRARCPALITRPESLGVDMKVVFKRWIHINLSTHSVETLRKKGWKDFSNNKEFVADIEGPPSE
ncbi:hypothetical protein C8J56DRAFT_1052854 [Mycena floridula]|nr:hypothetical protein C8J56DRAFT_1052854 [Mycena floridula]